MGSNALYTGENGEAIYHLSKVQNSIFEPGLIRRSTILRLREELILAPLEHILHPSPGRLFSLGLTLCVVNLVFSAIWTWWLPQPYENFYLRLAAVLLSAVLMFGFVNEDTASPRTQRLVSIVFWLELPVFMGWMYLANSGNSVWLATVASMVLIYYHVTDWRLGTLGLISGGGVAWLLFQQFGPDVPPVPLDQRGVHAVMIGFAWSIALMLNLSSANLRRDQLNRALGTMAIMAHELRTPLSSAALLADAVQMEARRQLDDKGGADLTTLSRRLHQLVHNMNRQIDTQIANAKLLQLPRFNDVLQAQDLVRDAVDQYPYATQRLRECVEVVVDRNFAFRSSSSQFTQVLSNLIKNALHSLMAKDMRHERGALQIYVTVANEWGVIRVRDKGIGIPLADHSKIFEPFFSTDSGAGHGLGLAFCMQVVKSAGGNISVDSRPGDGASFFLELPLDR